MRTREETTTLDRAGAWGKGGQGGGWAGSGNDANHAAHATSTSDPKHLSVYRDTRTWSQNFRRPSIDRGDGAGAGGGAYPPDAPGCSTLSACAPLPALASSCTAASEDSDGLMDSTRSPGGSSPAASVVQHFSVLPRTDSMVRLRLTPRRRWRPPRPWSPPCARGQGRGELCAATPAAE